MLALGLVLSVIISCAVKESTCFPHTILDTKYSMGAYWRYKGACQFHLTASEFTWTLNVTFDIQVIFVQFYQADPLSQASAARWVCAKNTYHLYPPTNQVIEFQVDFYGDAYPQGECLVVKNNVTHCASLVPETTTTTTTTEMTSTSTTEMTSTSTTEMTSTSTTEMTSTSTTEMTSTSTTEMTSTSTTEMTSTSTTEMTSTSTTEMTSTSTRKPTTTSALQTTTTSTIQTTTATTQTPRKLRPPFTIENNQYCLCCHTVACTLVNGSSELGVKLQELVSELLLDTQTLSSTRRKLTSAADDRPSSHGIGWMGLFCVMGLLLLVVSSDLLNLFKNYNCSSKTSHVATTVKHKVRRRSKVHSENEYV